MFCSNCGKENLSSNHFCGSCGQALIANNPYQTSPPSLQYQSPPPYPAYIQPAPSESAFSLYLGCFKKYAQFHGRARRSEYWYFALFHWLVILLLMLIGIFAMIPYSGHSGIGNLWGMIIAGIYFVVGIIPSLSVLSRRLHDTGRSGAWVILFIVGGLVPLINLIVTIVQLVFTVQDSQPGTNQYGPSPKYPGPPFPSAYPVPYPVTPSVAYPGQPTPTASSFVDSISRVDTSRWVLWAAIASVIAAFVPIVFGNFLPKLFSLPATQYYKIFPYVSFTVYLLVIGVGLVITLERSSDTPIVLASSIVLAFVLATVFSAFSASPLMHYSLYENLFGSSRIISDRMIANYWKIYPLLSSPLIGAAVALSISLSARSATTIGKTVLIGVLAGFTKWMVTATLATVAIMVSKSTLSNPSVTQNIGQIGTFVGIPANLAGWISFCAVFVLLSKKTLSASQGEYYSQPL